MTDSKADQDAILKDVQSAARVAGLDPEKELIFKWQEDIDHGQWCLVVLNGPKRDVLKFRKIDVEDWPPAPQMAEKYSAEIRAALERIKLV